jgi:hypothetical protein
MRYRNFRGLSFFAMVMVVTGCGNNNVDMGAVSKQQVCKATISTVMSKSPSIMNIDRAENDVTYVSYIRPDDGTNWAYRCMFEGSTVVWASDTGRWRTDKADSKITFSISGSTQPFQGVDLDEK